MVSLILIEKVGRKIDLKNTTVAETKGEEALWKREIG